MKKIAVVVMIAAIALCAMPVLAADAPEAGKRVEKSLFQTISDEITNSKMPARFAVKPVVADTTSAVKSVANKKVDVFQNISDGIAQGSAKAKCESLRTMK
jgi:ABC-type proline/glycine betaine transport system substrate-binding protein